VEQASPRAPVYRVGFPGEFYWLQYAQLAAEGGAEAALRAFVESAPELPEHDAVQGGIRYAFRPTESTGPRCQSHSWGPWRD